MKFEYTFPVVYFHSDDPDDCEVEYQTGKIRLIHGDDTRYEAVISAYGYCYHVIYGKYQNGWYVCIPSKNFGCEMAYPDDISWNLNAMTKTTTDVFYEEAVAIVYGIAEIYEHIKQN